MPEKELSAFGWWFSGGSFDPAWSFQYLAIALKQAGVSRSNLYVFEYMSTIFESYPQESLRCIQLFIDNNDDPWFFVSNRKQKGIWAILEQGVQHADPEIRKESESIIHLLGSKGHLDYRELLKSGSLSKKGTE